MLNVKLQASDIKRLSLQKNISSDTTNARHNQTLENTDNDSGSKHDLNKKNH